MIEALYIQRAEAAEAEILRLREQLDAARVALAGLTREAEAYLREHAGDDTYDLRLAALIARAALGVEGEQE